MRTQGKWFVISGIVVAFAAALAAGMPVSTLLWLGAALLCPAAMFFGMGEMRMNYGCAHLGDHQPSELYHNTEAKPPRKAV